MAGWPLSSFEGFLVTDYGEIEALHGLHAVASDDQGAVKIAMLDTSIDMSMTAWTTDFITDLLQCTRLRPLSSLRWVGQSR